MSGISIDPTVVESFQEMKRGGVAWNLYKMNEDLTSIVVEDSGPKSGDCRTDHAVLCGKLPEKEPRYAVINVVVFSKKANREVHKMFFLLWAPSQSPIRQKMVYATTSAALKQALEGFNYHVMAGDLDEFAFEVLEEICDSKAR